MNTTEQLATKATGNDPVNWFLVFLATVLSAFNGLLSLLSVLVFSGHEAVLSGGSLVLLLVGLLLLYLGVAEREMTR